MSTSSALKYFWNLQSFCKNKNITVLETKLSHASSMHGQFYLKSAPLFLCATLYLGLHRSLRCHSWRRRGEREEGEGREKTLRTKMQNAKKSQKNMCEHKLGWRWQWHSLYLINAIWILTRCFAVIFNEKEGLKFLAPTTETRRRL